jgi:sugar phosphate isomerase/epimerase
MAGRNSDESSGRWLFMTHPILDRVSYHVVYDASIMDALEYARDNGFAGIQLAAESPHLAFEMLSGPEINEIAAFVNSEQVFVSIHAPDEAASLFQHSRHLRDGIQNYYRALFDFAAAVGALLVTIHIGGMATFRTDTRREMIVPESDQSIYREVVTRNLDGLLGLAAGRFTVCVESYALDEFSLFLLKSYLDDRRLALSWDLAKTWNKPALERFFFSNLDRVKQVHLHDVRTDERGNQRSHCVIGTGELDFTYYLNRLSDASVLDYCIEVRPREKAKESLAGLKIVLGLA